MNPIAAEALTAALAELHADSGTIHLKAPDQKLLLLAAWAGHALAAKATVVASMAETATSENFFVTIFFLRSGWALRFSYFPLRRGSSVETHCACL